MKRITICTAILLCLVLMAATFLSCGQEHENLIGRWETETEEAELGSFTMVYHFTDDGEIFVEQRQGDAIPFSIPFGTWRASGDQLTITSDGAEKTYTFSVTEKALTLSDGEGETLVFDRV